MKLEKKKFEFVYVENDGTVRELDKDEIEYLETEFEPSDGARPYIKSSYEQLTPDKKILGFLQRSKVPKEIEIINTYLRYLEIRLPINIYDSGKAIEVPVGIYSVTVLGGWDVQVVDFDFTLTNIKNGKVILPKVTKWRIQSYKFGQKAKKIMVLDVPDGGIYKIKFKNQKSLKVWNFEFPYVSRLFQNPIPNHYTQICIG